MEKMTRMNVLRNCIFLHIVQSDFKFSLLITMYNQSSQLTQNLGFSSITQKLRNISQKEISIPRIVLIFKLSVTVE